MMVHGAARGVFFPHATSRRRRINSPMAPTGVPNLLDDIILFFARRDDQLGVRDRSLMIIALDTGCGRHRNPTPST